MWFLSTDRAELTRFDRPPAEYAILSHVWEDKEKEQEKKEQTFQQLHEIIRTCQTTGVNPRDVVARKIRKCCVWAEAQGFKWVWIDSCCIDRTNSAELQEAINSMFAWYAGATVCFAFLFDVSTRRPPTASKSSFRRSRWFKRGWTLQELIAPKVLVFLSNDWIPIASKHAISGLLEEITGIDADVLLGTKHLHSVSVARRMSWASMRETTRDEDQAYCLMGIFGVNIPTIYGEGGERAFVRLQEEIMRRIPDTTLFAWGPHGDPVRTMVGYRSVFPTASLVGESLYTERSCLLAPSPAAFKDCSDLQVMTRKDFGAAYKTVKEAALHHPAFTTTSHGIQASCPAIHFPGACALLLLPCCRVRRGKTLLVALVLRFQGEEWPWSVGVRIVEEELTLVSKHGRALARVAEGLAARPPFVVRAQSHVDVRYVLLPKDFDFGRCLQRPVNQGDQHPFPTWDTKNYIAYRTEDVFRPLQRLNAMQESKPLQPLRARRHNLFFPKWVITGLEENGYTAPKLSGNSTSCMPLVVHSGQRLAVPFFDRDGKIKTEQMRLDIRADVPSPEAKEAALWCNVEFLSDGTEYKVSADEQRQDTHASKKVEPDGIFSRRLNEEGRPGAGDRAGSSAPSPADEEDVNVRAGFVDLWKHSGRQGRKEFSNGVWRFLITFTRLFNSDIHDAASPRTNNSYLVDIILSHSDA